MAHHPIYGPRLDRETREIGLAAAREWRVRMKPHFDALYGETPDLCPECGSSPRRWFDARRNANMGVR